MSVHLEKQVVEKDIKKQKYSLRDHFSNQESRPGQPPVAPVEFFNLILDGYGSLTLIGHSKGVLKIMSYANSRNVMARTIFEADEIDKLRFQKDLHSAALKFSSM